MHPVIRKRLNSALKYSLAALCFWLVAEVVWLFLSFNIGPFQWLTLYMPNGLLQYALRPDADVDARNFICRTKVKTNRYGMRDTDFPRHKAPGTVRIMAVGGSTTFGSYISDNEHTYPAVLERLLEKEFPKHNIEVINTAVPGYNTTNSLIHLITRLVYYEPDIVMIYHAINDIRDHLEFGQDQTPFDLLSHVSCADSVGYYVRNSLVYRSVSLAAGVINAKVNVLERRRQRRARRKHNAHTEGDGDISTGLDIYGSNLGSMMSVCRQHGIEPVMILFPYSGSLKKKLADSMFYYVGMTGMETAQLIDRYNERMKRTARAHNVAVVDPRIPGDADVWGDWCHLNDTGAELFSANVAVELADLIRQRLAEKEEGHNFYSSNIRQPAAGH